MNNLFKKEFEEVVEIAIMFYHLQKSAKKVEMSCEMFKFFGFPEGTIHYHIYRMFKLKENELKNKFRYRDQDENGLERCLAILKAYKVVVSERVRAEKTTLNKQTLEFIVRIVYHLPK